MKNIEKEKIVFACDGLAHGTIYKEYKDGRGYECAEKVGEFEY